MTFNTHKDYRITFKHVGMLAKKFGVSNIAMFNALLMGSYRDEFEDLLCTL